MPQNFGLGRGLSSLIPQKTNKINKPDERNNYFGNDSDGSFVDENKSGAMEIDINRIVPNPHQPRIRFDEIKLQELANSIREHGVIQPLVVTKSGGQFEIITGERRFQAAKIAGLKSVPAVIRKATEQEKLELAIIENIQRHDLNPMEEAKSFHKLTEEFGLSQDEIAKKVGKSRSAVANKLRLLNLPVEIQKALADGIITEGHAKAIMAVENPEKQRALFELIIKENLTVRQAEEKTKDITVRSHRRRSPADPYLKEIESSLIQKLGTKIRIASQGEGGKLIVEYYSKEDLDRLIDFILKG